MTCRYRMRDDKKNMTMLCGDRMYDTTAFHICGSSVQLARRMVRDGASPEAVMLFVTHEDKFLQHEIVVMCKKHATGTCPEEAETHADKMVELHEAMLEALGSDYKDALNYHAIHIETVRGCEGAAPSTLMSAEGLGCHNPLLKPALSWARRSCTPAKAHR